MTCLLDNCAEIKLAMDGDIWLQKQYVHADNLYNRSDEWTIINDVPDEWVYGPDQQF